MVDSSEWLAAYVMLGSISVGLGLIQLFAQDRTKTNLGMGTLFVLVGISFTGSAAIANDVDRSDPGWLPRILGVLEAAVIASGSLYMRGLLDTAQASPRAERAVSWVTRIGFGLAAWHAVSSVLLPAQRLDDFQLSVFDESAYDTRGFWIFAITWVLFGVDAFVGFIILAREPLDPAERGRVVTIMIAAPLLISLVFLPRSIGSIAGAVSMLLAMLGQFRYNVLQGRRGAFLSRFLSDQVTDLVRTDGLAEVMKPHEVALTVVACDLRGFTAYAEAVPSQAVIDLLAEYYDTVGDAVAEHGGTIKDYAGDGVLILVGAPLPRPDHAAAGLDLARRLHEVVGPVLTHWGTGPHPLGMGAGVASGTVTVGAVGASSRMEYTAVGTAVNLASRLCAAAGQGETLVDQSTAAVAGVDGMSPRGSMPIKGLTADHQIYAVGSPPDPSFHR
jgi:adenylate cyclase